MASAALPRSQRHVFRPSLVTVPAPLSTTTAPSNCAKLVAECERAVLLSRSISSCNNCASASASPPWGVKIAVPRRSRAASRCDANRRIASASMTSGRFPSATKRMTTLPAASLVPSAGPTTIALAAIIALSSASAAFDACNTPCSSTGNAITVASGNINNASCASGSGTAAITRPVPARNAPRAASITPPSMSRGECAQPPITNTLPNVPLCPAASRSGSAGSVASCASLVALMASPRRPHHREQERLRLRR